MRANRFLTLAVLLCCGLMLDAGRATAIRIDPELETLLATKDQELSFPILLVFDKPADAGDEIQDLDKLDPKKRRKLTLELLKRKALKAHQNALVLLESPQWAEQVTEVRQLYLAGAISFRGTAPAIEALSRLSDDGTLFHDRSYDLIRGTSVTRKSPPLDKVAFPDTAWSVKYIHADRVWRELDITGRGVIVGHVDTGVYLDHPDLAGHLWTNPGEIPGNGLDDDGNGFVDDIHGYDFGVEDGNPNDDALFGGHGTHTAGTVIGDGTAGMHTGVAPGAQLMACKIWQANGQGGSLGMIWAAEQYCVENGARIITMSLGIPGEIPAIFMRNDRVNCNNIRDAGVLLVNSAGNDHNVFEPPLELNLTARSPAPWNALPVPYSSTGGVLTVGATGYKADTAYGASSRGPADWGDVDPWNDWPYNPGPGLIKPDISAPGVGVNSTTILPFTYSGDTWNGTSMACPHVAGVAALMLEKNPSLSPAGLDSLLELAAVDVGGDGKDTTFGSGRLDAFAAVKAVPDVRAANISMGGILPDFSGDGVLDPGQISPVAFDLVNVSPVADAENITATLTVVADDLITVVDGQSGFGDLASGGAKGNNTGDPFRLEVDPEAPQGRPFTMLLTVTSGDFTRTFDMAWYVGLPEVRTHDAGHIYLTVTDQGSLGYLSQAGEVGRGMGVIGDPSSLFIGSFWAGTGADFVCNRDYDGLGQETSEWVVSNEKEDNGRVRDDSRGDGSQVFRAIFHDGGHEIPKPLFIEQTSYALPEEPNDDFVILEYTLHNRGDQPLEDLYLGVFCDFDVAGDGKDLGDTDASRNLAWIHSADGPGFGVALLDSNAAINATLIDNRAYVYAESRITDQDKFDLLSGAIHQPVAGTGDDWSLLVSTVQTLAPGESRNVAFAMLHGDDEDDMRANADAAKAAYLSDGRLKPEIPVQILRLDQNTPNPFNPETSIEFEVTRAGYVELAVYDLRGVKVRTLFAGNHDAGSDAITWNGMSDAGRPLPSGIYLYRLTQGPLEEARKMTLVR